MRFLLAVLFCVFPLLATAQEDDRGFLTRLIEDNLSGAGRAVRIEGFEGALSSRATIREMTIADDHGVWITLRGLELDWSRRALLTGRLEVETLRAEEILLPRLPDTGDPEAPTPEAVPFSLPDLPISVRIGQILAEKVDLGAPVMGIAATFRVEGSADLAGGEGNAKLDITRTDGPEARLSFDGGFANETRVLRLSLALEEAAGGIAGTLMGLPGAPALTLSVQGEGPLEDYTADIRLATDGQDRLAGLVALRAVEGASTFALDLRGDVAPLLLPEYRDFFGNDVALVAEGRRTPLGAVQLDRLDIAAAQLRVQGQARVAADGVPERLDLRLRIAAADGGPVLLPSSGVPMRVNAADLTFAFDAARGDGWRLSGAVEGLDRPDLRLQSVTLAGNGRIARLPEGATVGGTLRLAAEGIAPADPALAQAVGAAISGQTLFSWSTGGKLRLSRLAVTGEGYELSGRIALDSPPDGETRVETMLSAQMADFARLSGLAGRDLAGRGRVDVAGWYAPLSGAFDLTTDVAGNGLRVDVAELDRVLAGDSTVHLSAARGTEGLEIRSLTANARGFEATGRGWLRSAGSDLTLRAALADLAALGPRYGGSLRADLRVQGPGGQERVTLAATGADLRIGVAQVDGLLRGPISIDAALHRQGDALTLDRAAIAGDHLNLTASGRLDEPGRALTATARLPDLSAAGGGFGGAVEAQAEYALREGEDHLSLTARASDLRLGQPEADRVLAGDSDLRLQVRRTAGGAVKVDAFRLDGARLTAEATAEAGDAGRRVNLSARLADLAVVVPGVPGPLTVEGTVNDEGESILIDVRANGPGGIAATVAGSAAADFSRADLRINGQADAALANAFTGPVAMRGPLRFDLALNGPPGLAALSGQVALRGGRVTLTSPPLAFTGVDVTVDMAGGRAQVDARAGLETGGTVAARGPVALTAPYAGDLAITLTGLRLRDPNLYSTEASGALRVNGPLAGGAMISGRVELGVTELRIPSTGLGGVTAIPEMRHLREPAAGRATRARAGLLDSGQDGGGGAAARPYGLDLTIDAPNRVFIRGRGLDAELGGSVYLSGTTAAIAPSGGFTLIRGRLDLLGKRFDLTEGNVRLEGRFVPYVELAATTQTEDVTATIRVDGPADEPVISFTSSPELPQEEVVAQLLFGRGLQTLTAFQAAQLASAVATLTGKGGAGIIDRLRRSFGLDDLDVGTSATGETSLRVGKYLSENLYADVMFESDGTSEVTLNLDVSRNVTVRGSAASDGETGVGIFYERDY
ncbi:translocation/assembly module TamB domain-containing protein [Ruixingdingia sedimenti]|uniref:Translocation/assembly module TamB domain-containing protein n=1 Tax=Ruixingdingia sedimenti TaxID=3073604 RepID=A0ABU1F698_9RHOB|nr:translocation/assembly module TamB domain-containing protein [Xinfangfangia sp. LG-4]MDR5652386.1 translocation/assembly module TamB domain-containing protein [Xinfangfangia sp. LG-4]